MCGIGVVWRPKKGGIPAGQKYQMLHDILDAIRHRGQTFFEAKVFDDCAMGANRLRIVGRDEGTQPKGNENGQYWAVLNGEIYNYASLRSDLKTSGHKFSGVCDTEVLVHLWEQHGTGMLKLLDSEMFSFAIYDSGNNKLFVARDMWGVKPLYWARTEQGDYYFASEIKALVNLPGVSEIKLFPPGHYFYDGKFEAYYVPSRPNRLVCDEKKGVEDLGHYFVTAVSKRVKTDLPVGVFLSGGVDSTSVLAVALRDNLDVLALIGGQLSSDDVTCAVRYCNENGVRYRVVQTPPEEELFRLVPKIVRVTESFEPNVIRNSAVSYLLSEAAMQEGLRVVLCGEGADELFLGYAEFASLAHDKMQAKQDEFLLSLHRTQFQRVDRTSMNFTVEVRVPFFDQRLVEYALSIDPALLVRRESKTVEEKNVLNKLNPFHTAPVRPGMEKYILRRMASGFLPDYVYNRRKAVLIAGAGYKGNEKGGLFYKLASDQIGDSEYSRIRRENRDWNIKTKEEAYYFQMYKENGYDKALFNQERVTANSTAPKQ